MEYKTLLTEKTKIRLTDPLRYSALTMILAGAAKIAKTENREVTEPDLISAVKTEMKNNEKAIELTKSKGGNTLSLEREVEILKSFVPKVLSEIETRSVLGHILDMVRPELKNKKSMGQVIQAVKAMFVAEGNDPNSIDMKLVSQIINEWIGS